MVKYEVDHCEDLDLLDLVYKLLSNEQRMQGPELWKDIQGWEGLYQVSSQGRVKSLRGGIFLKMSVSKGWPYKRVFLEYKGKRATKSVHRLVAQAFIPNPGNKPQVNHINGDKTDNRAINLEWVTASANIKHAYLLGRETPDGRRIKRLTEEQIKEIKKRYEAGVTKKELMREYGVCWVTIHRHTCK